MPSDGLRADAQRETVVMTCDGGAGIDEASEGDEASDDDWDVCEPAGGHLGHRCLRCAAGPDH